MQLYQAETDTKYRVFFNELETNNLEKIMGDDISIRNVQLCAYLEDTLPKAFSECIGKRVMVLNIYNERPYITAVVLLQDIDISFAKPKDKKWMLKATNISFCDGNAFKKWLLDKDYNYKIISLKRNKVKVVIFNMTSKDEMNLADSDAKINATGNIAKYILLETMYRLEKCFG